MEHTQSSSKITLPSRDSGSPAKDKRKKVSWIVRITALLIFCVVFYFVNTAGFADMHQKLYSEHKGELEILVRVVTRYDLVVSMHG